MKAFAGDASGSSVKGRCRAPKMPPDTLSCTCKGEDLVPRSLLEIEKKMVDRLAKELEEEKMVNRRLQAALLDKIGNFISFFVGKIYLKHLYEFAFRKLAMHGTTFYGNRAKLMCACLPPARALTHAVKSTELRVALAQLP